MNKLWYLPIAAVVGTASVTVWAQANAGPPQEDSPGVVVSDVRSDRTDDSSYPSPSHSATEDHIEIQHIPVEVQTYPANGPGHDVGDDKGGLRAPGASDDGPGHDVGDDKGGLRAPGVSDDGPAHDVGDDKGGLRAPGVSDDGPGDDKGGLRAPGVSDDGPGDDKGGLRAPGVSDDGPNDD